MQAKEHFPSLIIASSMYKICRGCRGTGGEGRGGGRFS